LKDKKIIDLAKKNRALQLQAESLKTKAAKAAEFALSVKNESPNPKGKATMKETTTSSMLTTSGPSSSEIERHLKESEQRVVKLRNEKQEQKILIEKATRLLEREIGEVVDIN